MPESRLVPHLLPEDDSLIRTYLQHRLPFFIEGGPGIGKSLAADYLGRIVYHQTVCPHPEKEPSARGCICEPLKIDITEDTEVRHLLGEMDFVRYFLDAKNAQNESDRLGYFRKGRLVQAMETGRLLIIEELDRAGRETLFPVLFDAIEKKRTYIPELGTIAGADSDIATIRAQPNFNIVITVNRFTDVGTVRLPEALLRRLRRVSIFDPSRVPPDGLGKPDSPATKAFSFEEEVVWNNLRANGIDPSDTQIRARVRELLELIYDLRHDLSRRPDPVLADEHITPAEAACYICDLYRCEAAALEQSDSKVLFAALRKHVGALAKNDAHALAVDSFLSMMFIEHRAPFGTTAQ